MHGTSATGSLFRGTVFEQSQSPALNFYSQSDQTVPLNQWCNVTMTFAQNTITLYIDNQLVGSSSDPNITINTIGNSGISIGLSEQANGQWSPFDGEIDDIGIWNRALTEQEIANLYNDCSNTTLTSQPVNTAANTNTTAQFSIAASNATSYQWQTDLGVGFQNVSNAGQFSGATNDTLRVSNVTAANNNQQFRCIINSNGCTDTSTVAVLSVSTNGINELISQKNFAIFPNPAKSNFEIKTNLLYDKIEIRDIQGRMVQIENKNKVISISSLQNGTYIIRLVDDKSSVVGIQQLVKE